MMSNPMPHRHPKRTSFHCGHTIVQFGYDDAGPDVYIDGLLRPDVPCLEDAKDWCEQFQVDVTEQEMVGLCDRDGVEVTDELEKENGDAED